jgi:hypothetical protein
LDTPPGTKVLLNDCPVRNGTLLLEDAHFTVLGGEVPTIIKAWKEKKKFKEKRTTWLAHGEEPPPTFEIGASNKGFAPLPSLKNKGAKEPPGEDGILGATAADAFKKLFGEALVGSSESTAAAKSVTQGEESVKKAKKKVKGGQKVKGGGKGKGKVKVKEIANASAESIASGSGSGGSSSATSSSCTSTFEAHQPLKTDQPAPLSFIGGRGMVGIVVIACSIEGIEFREIACSPYGGTTQLLLVLRDHTSSSIAAVVDVTLSSYLLGLPPAAVAAVVEYGMIGRVLATAEGEAYLTQRLLVLYQQLVGQASPVQLVMTSDPPVAMMLGGETEGQEQQQPQQQQQQQQQPQQEEPKVEADPPPAQQPERTKGKGPKGKGRKGRGGKGKGKDKDKGRE